MVITLITRWTDLTGFSVGHWIQNLKCYYTGKVEFGIRKVLTTMWLLGQLAIPCYSSYSNCVRANSPGLMTEGSECLLHVKFCLVGFPRNFITLGSLPNVYILWRTCLKHLWWHANRLNSEVGFCCTPQVPIFLPRPPQRLMHILLCKRHLLHLQELSKS